MKRVRLGGNNAAAPSKSGNTIVLSQNVHTLLTMFFAISWGEILMDWVKDGLRLAAQVLQIVAVVVFAVAAGLSIGFTLAALFGWSSWLVMPLTFGGQTYPQAGIYVQTGLTLMLVLLCSYLPANMRIMTLENSHRRFHMGMRDVARAYAMAHASDRAGVFEMSGEFDSIRERIAFLRDHPDLTDLEPSVLELAAQMSHVSRELAVTYSDDAVMRARDFLTARQQEVEDFDARLEHAKGVTVELRNWLDRVDLEESVARSQLDRLREELAELMPELIPPRPSAPAAEALLPSAEVAHLPRAAE